MATIESVKRLAVLILDFEKDTGKLETMHEFKYITFTVEDSRHYKKTNQNERTSAKVTRRQSEANGVRIASFLSLLASDNARLERCQTAVMLKLDHQ